MSAEAIERMVALVEQGYTPRSVVESSLTFSPGSSVKVNRTTPATDPSNGSSITVPEGEVVTILGVGGGDSGNDGHVLRADGSSQAIIPYQALGEALVKEDEEPGQPIEEGLTGVVSKITLAKPLPQSVTDWLGGGYHDYDVQLPYHPQADSSSSVTFLMKAPDEDMLEMAKDTLKKMAGASYKSDAESNLTDWQKATGL